MSYLVNIDRRLLKWAYQRPFNYAFPVKALIFIGDGPFWLIIVFFSALAGQLLKIESCFQLTILLMTGFVISNIIFFLCKTNIKRRRPYANKELQLILQMTINNRDPGHGSKEFESFPSGHALWTTLSVVLICFEFGYVSILLIGWLIPAMIFLRPHLGVHYPSDVLAGAVLGGVTAAVAVFINTNLEQYIIEFKNYSGYLYVYWIFISMFLFIGFKSWLKRV